MSHLGARTTASSSSIFWPPAWSQLNDAMTEWAPETTLADVHGNPYDGADWRTGLPK